MTVTRELDDNGKLVPQREEGGEDSKEIDESQPTAQEARRFHSFANMFPLPAGEEFSRFADKIEADGLADPIVLYDDSESPDEGDILDGRTRYLACLRRGVEPRYTSFQGTREQALHYVISHNLDRRHLNPGQIAAIGLEVESQFAAMLAKNTGGRPRNDRTSGDNEKPVLKSAPVSQQAVTRARARELAAELTGVAPSTIGQAKRLQAANPAAVERVRRGEVSLNKAYTEQFVPSAMTVVKKLPNPDLGGARREEFYAQQRKDILTEPLCRMVTHFKRVHHSSEQEQVEDLLRDFDRDRAKLTMTADDMESAARTLLLFAARLRQEGF